MLAQIQHVCALYTDLLQLLQFCPTKRTKTLPPETFRGLKVSINAFAAGAPSRTPQGKLTAFS